jgi:cytochrome c
MKKQIGSLALLAIFAAAPLTASADEALAKSKACLACHQVEKKVVGPAFKDVSAKYKGNASAAADLAKKIKGGTKGVWGQVPMPAQNVTDEEAAKLAKWVLAL